MIVIIWIVDTKTKGNHIQKGLPRCKSTNGRKIVTRVEGPLVRSNHEILSFQCRSALQTSVIVRNEIPNDTSRFWWR